LKKAGGEKKLPELPKTPEIEKQGLAADSR
jgi:hypothetical protein